MAWAKEKEGRELLACFVCLLVVLCCAGHCFCFVLFVCLLACFFFEKDGPLVPSFIWPRFLK